MDFGVYARGYAQAAKTVADSVREDGFADYQAYPAVFLYRHALELYLKCIIAKGIHLASLTGQAVVAEMAYCHDLSKLFRAAKSILLASFPGDDGLGELLDQVRRVVDDLHSLDRSSYLFRYPVDKQGHRPVSEPIHCNLASIAVTMNSTLDQLESVELGLDVNTDRAQEILEIMQAAGDTMN